jgi:hypothetical protein
VGIAFAAGAEEMGDDAGTTGTDGSRLPTASAPHPYPSVTTQSLHAKNVKLIQHALVRGFLLFTKVVHYLTINLLTFLWLFREQFTGLFSLQYLA